MEIARELPAGLPKVLVKAIEFTNSLVQSPERQGLMYLTRRHVDCEDERRTRLERRQAQALVLSSIIARTDLSTMQVRATVSQLARDAGLYKEDTGYHQRASRALHDLMVAGWVFMEKTRVLTDGEWKTVTRMRLNEGVFTILGGERFGNWVKHEIRRAKGRAKALLEDGKKSLKEFFRERADRMAEQAFEATLAKIKPSKIIPPEQKSIAAKAYPGPLYKHKQSREQAIYHGRDSARRIAEMHAKGMTDQQIIAALKSSPPAPA